ncbi:hypothetical protein, partial [Cellulomonas sp. GbtcB1]|uniref:hypothetical protein n=1 Tax=Cellulomonas sp. GbtcB1 TaxID=2824746 RepID=UPI001C30AD07
GPKRPQDRIELTEAKESFAPSILDYVSDAEKAPFTGLDESVVETFPASDPIAAGEHTDSSAAPAHVAAGDSARRPHR